MSIEKWHNAKQYFLLSEGKSMVLCCLYFLLIFAPLFVHVDKLCAAKFLPEKPIVVVICSYNNREWVANNLDSVFNQQYENYRVIYVDDGSNDGTGAFVENYKEQHGYTDKLLLIKNTCRKRKLANIYKALYLCEDREIVIMLDGDDWLAHDTVFSTINEIYQTKDVWFTYGQYVNVPAAEAHKWGFDQMGYCAPVSEAVIQRHTYRRGRFVYMHMRSFYAWLFKQIKLEDLIAHTVTGYEGNFYPASNDLAMYFPIVEMAHTRTLFIPDVLYIRNLYSDLVGFKIDATLQQQSAMEIRYQKKPYPILKYPVYKNIERYRNNKATLCVVLESDFSKLEDFLNNVVQNINNLEDILVFFKLDRINQRLVRSLQKNFPQCRFIYYDTIRNGFKNTLISYLKQAQNNHIFFTTMDALVCEFFDAGDMIYWLERTQAHAFYTTKEVPSLDLYPAWMLPIDDTVFVWKFEFGKEVWPQVYTAQMTLYQKKNLVHFLQAIDFNNVENLLVQLNKIKLPLDKIGIFYEKAKVQTSRTSLNSHDQVGHENNQNLPLPYSFSTQFFQKIDNLS